MKKLKVIDSLDIQEERRERQRRQKTRSVEELLRSARTHLKRAKELLDATIHETRLELTADEARLIYQAFGGEKDANVVVCSHPEKGLYAFYESYEEEGYIPLDKKATKYFSGGGVR